MSNRNFSGEPRPEKKKEGRTTADFTGSQEEILYEQITKLIKKGQNEENAKEAVNRFGEALAIAKTLNQDHITNTCEFNLAAAKIASDESVSDYMNSMKTNFDDNYEMEFNLGVMKEKQGNLEDALISYERAKTKCGNDKAMEKDCLQRKLKILKRRNKYAEAKTTGEQLEKLYEGKDSMTECELLDIDRHMVDLTLDQKQLIDQVKPLCKRCEELPSCKNQLVMEFQAKVLNDVGMLAAETKELTTEAIALFKKASGMSNSCRTLLNAEIKQNAGAMKTILGSEQINKSEKEFQGSIALTEEARKLYSKVRFRNSEGQCYMNVAFAQSCLYEIFISKDKGNDAKNALKETKLAYQHALQAAEDTGDIKMKMQAHEGLAAVCYRKEDFEGCKKCLEMAKVSATFSSDKARLAEKLEHLERTKK
ncbi:tetratricopeptide repeat protein 24-like isoform X2 [Mya arenaria]|uniref:tetratricopeptide repeat protein 24-like isoform X2 n=1 Tax=Mya arenaria TaxID=6604 RepID=UPI0022E2A7FB|nr:tetratricopeptide repeat protein 24-like isoform X2 [Mya arenaria]